MSNAQRAPIGKSEFVALMAMLGGTVAFSIDAMLPGLPLIGAELSPTALNRAQLVVTSFVLGMGAGTFLMGPLSDAFGRKKIILLGALLYALTSLTAMLATSLELLIMARILQGFGVAAARIVSMAILRDLYAGREMARMTSFVMMVFTLVPAVAPLIGTGIIALVGWRGIFGCFVIFAALFSLWLSLRLPEPLPPENRRPFRSHALWSAMKEVLSNSVVRRAIAVQSLVYAMLFAAISSVQQIMSETFDRAAAFPYWFGLIALIAGAASLLNASLVMRLGMRRLISSAFMAQVLMSLITLALLATDPAQSIAFTVYIIWQIALFAMVSLTLGNLNALTLEPLGHIAGMGASLTTGLATVVSVMLAIPIGLAFNGTPIPLIIAVLICTILGLLLMRHLKP